ncbi:pectate lyase family protein [Carboxylicivirga linearis]|uniref:T9SS type A sorting domain-containing protein n=1 Tax=Carboxylicivirga linearis TaxID=1628157 RepID=A0ABS5JVI7_9BACT|nr:T9SS type A sorting domain-containing protein [Carboxylicivirga linearis]MBS2098336.1 T9SS type A sorting domain-containing protein [Carboxylicivirga linearis]
MKSILILLAVLSLSSIKLFAQSVTIIESVGWFETATVKWQPVEGAEAYNVYCSGEGITNFKIDDQLIRNYGDYYRADIPGLQAGEYTLKVVPVIDGVETESTETNSISVIAHDRTGFSFSDNRVPGAYKEDGTAKDNAVIIYITENSKNTISMDVTGANENPCVGLQEILDGFKKGNDNRPLIIRMVGQITDFSYMNKGDIVVENKNNPSSYITIEGIGNDAVADGWGIRLKNASNIEIRNLAFMNCNSDEGDNLGLQQDNDFIWVHHCDLFYGDAGGDSDQAKGDGALDCKRSTYVTFSYNHFWDTGKSCLLGLGEDTTEGLYITYHHNWFDHSDSRHPRVRFFSAHVYNNYYDGNAKYGVGATSGSSVFVEDNYFRNCKYPMLISQQGTDIYYDSDGTFSGEDGGIIKAFNNYMEGQNRFVAWGDEAITNSTLQFDAYVASSKEELVPEDVITVQGANSYNNFDTNEAVMYEYTSETPEDAKATVMEYAGRMEGGDFIWAFDNSVDDASYEVNQALKNALSAYQTTLVSIQGDAEDDGSGDGGDDGGPVDEGDMIHNFTLSGLNSSFYNISGNLSDSKGTVVYNGLTLTQCLKIESATSISFTSTQNGQLTLVFNEGFEGKFKVNGTAYYPTNGILNLDIAAGDYEFTKGDVANLYFMSLEYDTTTGVKSRVDERIKLYPNPVIDYISIEGTNSIIKVEVYNMQGIQVMLNENCQSFIDVRSIPSGTYLVKIVTVKDTQVHTVFKK